MALPIRWNGVWACCEEAYVRAEVSPPFEAKARAEATADPYGVTTKTAGLCGVRTQGADPDGVRPQAAGPCGMTDEEEQAIAEVEGAHLA
jgi:hypothetical protein